MRDELVRDRIVIGVRDNKLREYLIDVDDLTLVKCVQKAKQYVSHHDQARRMGQQSNEEVEEMRVSRQSNSWQQQQKQARPRTMNNNEKQPSYDNHQRLWKKCFLCGKEDHMRNVCPAQNSNCRKCKQRGHWEHVRACKGREESRTISG